MRLKIKATRPFVAAGRLATDMIDRKPEANEASASALRRAARTDGRELHQRG
jgi:hypothetical protein